MVTVPGFLLRRLYVKGSLRNTEEGFAFDIKNSLGSGYARAMRPLVVDGQEAPMEQSFFTVSGQTVAFSDVSSDVPFGLVMNRASVIEVKGVTLAPGPHKVVMGFEVQGLGVLHFDFTDTIADG